MPPSTDQTLLELVVASINVGSQGTDASWSATVDDSGAPQPFRAVIDSTLPFLYLPSGVCDEFASRLGLTHDPATDLYILNNTQRTTNKQTIQSITFALVDTEYSGNSTTIELGYNAFDLEATLPLYEQATPYFPIRKSLSGDHNVLGRAFLQEAYVIADFERHNFTIAQAQFPNPLTQDIRAIYNTTFTPAQESSHGEGLSGGAIAGIVIGALAAVGILGAMIFWLMKRKQRRRTVRMESDFAEEEDNVKNRRTTISTVGTVGTEATAISHEMAAFPERPAHSRNISELSSDSEVAAKRTRGLTPSAIYELEDMSDATQLAQNERRANELPSPQTTVRTPVSPTSPHPPSETQQ